LMTMKLRFAKKIATPCCHSVALNRDSVWARLTWCGEVHFINSMDAA